jgi:hypothetical protein
MLKNQIQNILNPIINSGKKISYELTDKYWIKNYNDIYINIIEYSKINNLRYKTLSELIYCIINDITIKPLCNCSNDRTYKNFNIGYIKTCGNKKCSTNILESKLNGIIKKNKTIKEKYGVNNISQLDSIKRKKENTMLSNYGVKYNSQRDVVKDNISNKLKDYNINKNEELRYKLLSKIQDIEIINLYNTDRYLTDLKCRKCKNEFTISQHLAQERYKFNRQICTICNPIEKYYSNGEKEIYEFIKENYNGDIKQNDRTILNGKELDIYLHELGLAFEFNGLYWHSENEKHNNYHLEKTNLCELKNIQLIHIYEDDWLYKPNIIKSRILNLINKSERIYARKCDIRLVNNREKIIFLNNNHIQGNCNSSTNLGLYFNNELVSLITFGNRKITGLNQFELLRFCNKINTTVIGGASKLFKYFINNYDFTEIISYADRSWSIGNLYQQMGFNFVYNTVPNYYWVINGIKSNRFNWRKSILVKQKLLNEGETEKECMYRLGYYRIFDSGSKVFKYIDQP